MTVFVVVKNKSTWIVSLFGKMIVGYSDEEVNSVVKGILPSDRVAKEEGLRINTPSSKFVLTNAIGIIAEVPELSAWIWVRIDKLHEY